jgi:hypothetical protein
MVNGLECFPGQYIGELFLYDTDEQDEYEVIQHAYPDSAQLGDILGTPDKPELHVLAETLGDAEEVFVTKEGMGQEAEHLSGFERLHEHDEGDTDSRYVAVAQAQSNEGIGSASGEVAVGHVINED